MSNLSEVVEFLSIAEQKGFINGNTVVARKTALNKFVEILEPDQRTVDYLLNNLDIVKSRFGNLNKDVRGETIDQYAKRIGTVLADFEKWKSDRTGWEREVSTRQSSRTSTEEKKRIKIPKPDACSSAAGPNAQTVPEGEQSTSSRKVTFPLRPDFESTITLPREGIKICELKKLMYFLLPYTSDWDPSAKTDFPLLDAAG